MSPSDIVDDIDRLVDEQLAGGEPSPADQRYPKCGHCGRDFHHLVVTERIAAMYVRGVYEEDYRVGGDDSRVLCRGSGFIGPMPPETQGDALTDGGQVVIDNAWLRWHRSVTNYWERRTACVFRNAAQITYLAVFITGEDY